MFGKVTNTEANVAIGLLFFLIIGISVYLGVLKHGGTVKFAGRTFRLEAVLYNAICISALLQVFSCFLQYFGADLLLSMLKLTGQLVRRSFEEGPNVITGTLFNKNFLSAYLVFSSFFFLRKRWIWLYPIAIFPVVFMTNSLAAMLALVAGLAFYLYRSGAAVKALRFIAGETRLPLSMILWALVLIIIVLLTAYVSTSGFNPVQKLDSVGARWKLWSSALVQIFQDSQYVFFGFGPGKFTGYRFHIHNDWVEIWFRYGIIAVGFGVWYLKSALKTASPILGATLIAFAVNSFGSFPIHRAPCAFLLLIVMALIARGCSENEHIKGV